MFVQFFVKVFGILALLAAVSRPFGAGRTGAGQRVAIRDVKGLSVVQGGANQLRSGVVNALVAVSVDLRGDSGHLDLAGSFLIGRMRML